MSHFRDDFERRALHIIDTLVSPTGRRLRLLVAVSGGADSVALLRILTSTRGRSVCEPVAVNCNFHLRGAESDRDSKMVERLCHSLGVPLRSVSFDTEDYAGRHPEMSVEMVCRQLRYDAFREICVKEDMDYVAVAHNLDDNAETLLLNLMRGAGSRGLKGMRAVTPDGPGGCSIVRPLLSVSRRDIERYLTELGQEFVTDSSNLESDYNRNFLRLEVLPLLASRWPSVKEALATSAAILGEENVLVTQTLDRLSPPGKKFLAVKTVEVCGAPVSLLLHFIAPFGGTPSQAVEMARLPRRIGARWLLPDGLTAEARPDGWVITAPPQVCEWVWEKVEMTPEEWKRLRQMPPSEGVYVPDGPEEYVLRPVRKGDRMRPSGLKGSKLVSDLLKEARIPVSLRASKRVLVSAATGEIIWLEGIRRSDCSPVSPDARHARRLTRN